MQFGRAGERFICYTCGGFYDWIYGCRGCKAKKMSFLMSRKTADKRAKGIPIKSWQKRGKKAYVSRLVNMAFTDPKRYNKLIKNMEIKDGNRRRSNSVKRKVAERKTKLI